MSDSLLKACVVIDGANWELMSVALDISQDDRSDIRKSQSESMVCRQEVLNRWKKPPTLTVGKFLQLLKIANIGRDAIKKSYEKLFGHS